MAEKYTEVLIGETKELRRIAEAVELLNQNFVHAVIAFVVTVVWAVLILVFFGPRY